MPNKKEKSKRLKQRARGERQEAIETNLRPRTPHLLPDLEIDLTFEF